MDDPTCAAFLAELGARAAAVPDGLSATLARLVAEARAAHPALVEDGPAFAREIARRLPAGADLVDFLDHFIAPDLALAAACAGGRPGAIERFEQTFAREIDVVLRRFASLSHSADDLRQVLRERLFVAEGARPARIGEYAGQGFLANWLRVTAVRTFLDLAKRRDRARETPVDDAAVLGLIDPSSDLELDFLKREYRAEFARALAEAAESLTPGDRNLLRQHLTARLGIDQLAAVYGIHRATAARRLARAREALLTGTRAALIRRLVVDDGELDSIMALIASRLDVSVARLLAGGAR